MTETDKWIESTYKQLDKKVKEQEDEFLAMFVGEYLSEFYIDDTTLKNTSGNYEKVNQVNAKFDEAYDAFIVPFLLWYGNKLIEAGQVSLNYFKSIGINANSKDVDYLAKMIGLNGKSIVKGSFLWNLGKMGEMRQRLQEMLLQAVSSSQKFSQLVRNVKPLFKSTSKQRSALSTYFLKYAYQPIMQSLNGTSYHLAKKYGLTKFKYAGDLVEKSRSFCIHRKNRIFTIEEAQSWNQLEWKGKMKGVDFFIQVGGWNCLDHLDWINNETP